MQIDGIERKADTHEVANIDPQAIRQMLDVHVVCLYRQIQFARFFQDVAAQRLIALADGIRVVCKICHVVLQFQIVQVDRTE